MLDIQDLEGALAGGYELRGLELKGPGVRTDNHLFAKVARAALSMGNLRDGGHVVIGIEDSNPAAMLPGLDAGQLSSWLAYDDIARKLAEYSDPALQFAIAQLDLSSGASVVLIEVSEFADIPHLCKRHYESVLRQGALYVRPRKVPETSEVASSVEMREIIQLATEKALRSYVETAMRAGLTLGLAQPVPTEPLDMEQYRVQRERAW